MLENLHVKNLALIDEIEVDFRPGLNILTGETGAGKSILLGSVNLALGGRYSADMLRTGAQSGLVELTFSVEDALLKEQLKALDIYPEDGRIVLSRRLSEGRSVSRINGETVSRGVLKDVASLLIDIHGQHEHQSLLHKKNHLGLLDLFAGERAKEVKKETGLAYKNYRKCVNRLEESALDEGQRMKELSLAEFEINEIEGASLSEGEDAELEQLYKKMIGGKRLAEGIAEAYRYTGGDAPGNAGDAVSRAVRALQEIQDVDRQGGELYGQLLEIESLLSDFNRELSEYAQSFSFSEEDLYEAEERLNVINRLKTKYGNSVSKIQAYCAEKKQRLEELKDYETYIQKLKEEKKNAEQIYLRHAGNLSRIRKEVALIFAGEIRKGLADLNFLGVQFEIRFSDTKEYTQSGVDEVEFFISTNPGEALRPLSNVASGGELSRIMLAIKTILADKEAVPTLIFDEIDSGISGITAGKVAEKMHIIGKTCQVLAITHLAQIAARADAHYLIKKESRDNVTKTSIACLDERQSVEELARLLGGENITPSILVSAAEMKRHVSK